jgi:glycolate oxidase
MSAYPFHAISNSDSQFFTELLGANALFSEEQRLNYGHDETEDLSFIPEVVLKPETVEEVALIMKYAHQHAIPVTPSGARTGLSGGALPIEKGIALTMEKFNKIREENEALKKKNEEEAATEK